ncbi:MAG: histidine kinase, partial [Flavobacteriaceae bacterium]
DKLQKINCLQNTSINAIKQHNKSIWIATNNGLWKATLDFNTKQKLSAFNFKSIETYKNNVFCASFMNGILVFNETADEITFINEKKRINAINIIGNELWIATDNKGISVIDASNYKLLTELNKNNDLPISHIRKTIKDNQSNIWVASSGGGIFKILENNFTHFNKSNGLKGNRVYAINAVDDAFYFSTSEEGLSKIDSLGIHSITQDSTFLNVKVKTIAHDNNGNLFCGTDGKGLLVIHNSKKDSIITRVNDENRIVRDSIRFNYQFTDTLAIDKNNTVKWIRKVKTHQNTVWVASYSSGISKFNYNSNTRSIENQIDFKKKDGVLDLYINDIAFDANGTLWYATKNGHLGKIKNNKVTHLGNVLNKNTSIRTLLFRENYLFIATSGKGIWWANLSKPLLFNKLSGKKNLYSDNIYQLIFDADNNLWAGSENGVDKITLTDNNIIKELQHFGRNDGFLGIETCLNSVIKDHKNNLWFGTIYGLTKYQPNTTKYKQTKPTLFLENIEVMNQGLDTLLIKNYAKHKKQLHLKPTQNLLGFYFKTIDLNNSKEIQYRWKIDDSNWSPWNTDTKVNIASNYGKHVFYAQSRNLNWLESDPVSFQYHREKPMLQKTWFQWLLLGIITFIIGLFIRQYFKKLKFKNEQIKNQLQLENDLLSLEQKALRLQMNPHFIFNVLNGIKAMSINDTKTMHTTINKFATLLRATLSNSRKDNITLSEEVLSLKNYIEVEQLMAVKPFTYKLNLTTKLDAEEILIPPMLIQPFVENAIKHGINSLKNNGHLEITFATDEHFLKCIITDNGIGIKRSKQEKQKSNHQSMALQVTKERIEHLSGKESMEIIDLSENNKLKTGTEVRFKIPLLTDY